MAETETYHTIVIGAGSGGFTVAIGLTGFSKRVAVVEARHVGGDCTNVGCVPSKTLIHEADARPGDGDSAQAFTTVQQKRDHLRDEETAQLQGIENLDLIFGHARFLDAHRLAVALPDGGAREIMGEHVVIATGSRPRALDIPGLPPERVLTNETVFDLPEAPRHLAIIGSGPIGMELASAFQKLGSQVTVLTPGARVLTKSAREASEVLQRAYAERGIAIYTHARAESYDLASGSLSVAVNGTRIVVSGVDRVLVAVGRVRNIDALELERAGVRYDLQSGIPTDSYGRTNIPHIYAIGDVTPTSHFTHSANAQGRRVVQRIALPWLPAFSREPNYPSATYSDPEVASAGLTPEQIARRYHPDLIRRVRVELSTLDRGYTDGVAQGFVQIDAVRLTGRILGATIVGPHAADMLSLLTLAIARRISLYTIYQIVFPYPSYSEGIKKAADAYLRATLPNIGAEIAAYLRYRLARPPRDPKRAPHTPNTVET
jgi:pyruvate/2-oxoglutarate dehydrogenase complex dihydrolipoamide dehydrogenase (E3) component